MEKLYSLFPRELVTFVLVVLFSLLIGLSQRKLSMHKDGEKTHFGTDRTFTFIGILGYLLYMLDPVEKRLFLGGGFALTIFFALNYYEKMTRFQIFGITSIVIGLITYCLAPIVMTQPSWFYVMVVVVVLLFTEMKETFMEIAQRMRNDELLTLAKFLTISGIILPILPEDNLINGINLTPYTVWLATVVVSGMSYLSYLLKRYVFHHSGIFVSGILGGLYSSTAAIAIMAKKCKNASAEEVLDYASAMLMAVSMMYLRFLVLIFIFSREMCIEIAPYLLVLSLVAGACGGYLHHRCIKSEKEEEVINDEQSNPLEFKVALIFAALLVVFTVITHYTLLYMGTTGLNVLSFLSGLTDITPYILNLLQAKGEVPMHLAVICSMQAIISNIFVNVGYAYFFSARRKELMHLLLRSFSLVVGLHLFLLLFYSIYC